MKDTEQLEKDIKKAAKALTKQQKHFVDALLSGDGLDQQEAYTKAYKSSSKSAARANAVRLMKSEKVALYLNLRQELRSIETQIDANYVLERCRDIDQMDVLDILEDDLSIKPLNEWPKVWRTSISGVEVSEMFEYYNGKKDMVGLLKKIKWPDKLKNLELLGKHVDIQAFSDRVSATHKVITDDGTNEW